MKVTELRTGQIASYKDGNRTYYVIVLGVLDIKPKQLLQGMLNNKVNIIVVCYRFLTMSLIDSAYDEESLFDYLRNCVKNVLNRAFETGYAISVELESLTALNIKPFTSLVEGNIVKSKMTDEFFKVKITRLLLDTPAFIQKYSKLETDLNNYLTKLQKGFFQNLSYAKEVTELKQGEIYVDVSSPETPLVQIYLYDNKSITFKAPQYQNDLKLFVFTYTAYFMYSSLKENNYDYFKNNWKDTGCNVFDLEFNRGALKEMGVI